MNELGAEIQDGVMQAEPQSTQISHETTEVVSVADRLRQIRTENMEDIKPVLGYLRTEVTPETFLADRYAQALLNGFLLETAKSSEKPYSLDQRAEVLSGSPFPEVHHRNYRYITHTFPHRWKESGGGIERRTFMLKDDNEHLYLIPNGANEGPPYPHLREADVVTLPESDEALTGLTANPYSYDLERASISGGPFQVFNYHTGQWQEREYSPGFKEITDSIDPSEITKADLALQNLGRTTTRRDFMKGFGRMLMELKKVAT